MPKMVLLPDAALVSPCLDVVIDVCDDSETEDADVNTDGVMEAVFCRKEDVSWSGRSELTLKSSATSGELLLVIVVLDIVTGCNAQSCKV